MAGPDGSLWFAEYLAGMSARITTDGVVTEVLEVGGGPWGIGRGVGDTIWLTLFDGNRVARFSVPMSRRQDLVRNFTSPLFSE